MPNSVILGYGYRRTGVVNRPHVELTTPVDSDVVHLSVATAEFVSLDVFEVEIKSVGTLKTEFTFVNTLDAKFSSRNRLRGDM